MKQLTKKFLLILFSLWCSTIIISNKSMAIDLEPFDIHSESALVTETNSGNILYSKNSDARMYPASTTKIMTAILAIENCDLDELATVSNNAIALVPSGYTNAQLVVGEKISIRDLLYGLMLNSANEAANVLAEHISGSIDNFANLMNKKATELGCTGTHFVNANGMHDNDHYTTAKDLNIIATYCIKNENFRKIVSTVTYTLPTTNKYFQSNRIMQNTNNLITPSSKYFYEYAIGIKTGFTTQAGNCLVSCAEKNGIQIICVNLKGGTTTSTSNYRFEDGKKLLEYGIENFSNRIIISKDMIIDTIEVLNATEETKNVNIVPQEEISDYILNNIELTDIKPKITINNSIEAPLYSGNIVGTISYEINDKTYSTNLLAESTAEKQIPYFSYALIARYSIINSFSLFIYNKKEKITKQIYIKKAS